jgi:hypothetical protein
MFDIDVLPAGAGIGMAARPSGFGRLIIKVKYDKR